MGRPPSFALVLGGGGFPGMGFHAGVLRALRDHGLDPLGADLVVGTSAGANTAAGLRTGFDVDDLWAISTGEGALSDQATRALEAARSVDGDWTRSRRRSGPPLPASLQLTARTLGRWPPRPAAVFAGVAPRGTHPAELIGARLDAALTTTWPSEPTWIVVTRLRDGRRVVVGRDDVDASIGTAVAASSAVPGYFGPVTIGGHEYVDGGVLSPTNADTLLGCGFDLVVVSAPMTAPSSQAGWSPRGLSRRLYARMLSDEVARLRSEGTNVVVLHATREVLAAWPRGPLGRDSQAGIARMTHRSVLRHLEQRPRW